VQALCLQFSLITPGVTSPIAALMLTSGNFYSANYRNSMKTERMTPAQLSLKLSIQDKRSAKLFTPHALTDLSHFVNVRFIKGSSSTLVRRQYG